MSQVEANQVSSSPTSNLWAAVEQAPPDSILGMAAAYRADPSPRKLDLGIGAYRTEEGVPWVLPSVHEAEKRLLGTDKEYLPQDGRPEFSLATATVMLGADSPAIKEKRLVTVQSVGGTGALRLAAEFLKRYHNAPVYVSDPSWDNHRRIFDHAGLEVRLYRYFNASTNSVNWEGMTADLQAAPVGSVVVLHACAHNPTGVDLTEAQWTEVANICRQRQLLPLFDSAYQGYASGDLDADAFAVRQFVRDGFELLIAQSLSKNMGLYGDRVGVLSLVTANEQTAVRSLSQLKVIVRGLYSNPPGHGAKIAAVILNDPALRAQWISEVRQMAERLLRVRKALYEGLRDRVPGDWSHVNSQRGMFSFSGLSPQRVDYLREKHHVYMLRNGRISLAGLRMVDIDFLVSAIADAVANA